LAAFLSVPAALVSAGALGAGPAFAAGTFKSVDHNWTIGVNQASVHSAPSGGTFTYCASESISAITPSITYSGAAVGKVYTEKVIGPKAAGSITITATTNVDGDRTPLKFEKPSGVWDNTYAIMSFPGSVGHSTLPSGTYAFEVLTNGKVIARTTLRLTARSGC
jgi:hypothetical protein